MDYNDQDLQIEIAGKETNWTRISVSRGHPKTITFSGQPVGRLIAL